MRCSKTRDQKESSFNAECVGQGNTEEWEQAGLKQAAFANIQTVSGNVKYTNLPVLKVRNDLCLYSGTV